MPVVSSAGVEAVLEVKAVPVVSSAGVEAVLEVEAVPEVSPAGVEVRQLDADKEILAVSVQMTSSLFFFLFPVL